MATSAPHLQPPADAPADATPPLSRGAAAVLSLRFATIMAVLLGLAALPASSFFTVREVRVRGAVYVTAPEIEALAGVRPGDRLSAVPAEEIARRVTRHPRVARAAVSVGRLGVVTVQIAERAAYAAFPIDDHYLILDRTGIVLDEQASPGSLPVVSAAGFVPEWTRLGHRLPTGGVERALAALGRLPRAVLTPGTRVRVEPLGDLVLFTPDGIGVRLGPLKGLDDRAALMGEVLDAIRARGLALEYLDLRFSGAVVMKPEPADAAGDAGGR
jgi:cell division protein FtsQ